MILRLKHYYLPALILFVLFASLYIYTAAPTIYNGDTGEIAAAVNSLGLAHSTGFPLYMLTGKLFTLIMPWGEVAYKLNVYSALLTAGSVAFLFILLRSLGVSSMAAILATTIFGLGRNTIWANAGTVNVYSLTLFLSVLLLNIFVKWRNTKDRKYLYWYSLLFGVSLGSHFLIIIMASPLLFMLWSEIKQRRLKAIAYPALLSVLPLFQYTYLWIAYKRNMVITSGDISSFNSFFSYITQRDWANKIASRTLSDTPSFISTLLKLLSSEFSIIFFIAMIIGGIVMFKHNNKFFFFLLSLVFTNILIMFFYGNNQDLIVLNRYLFMAYLIASIVFAFLFDLIFKKVKYLEKGLVFVAIIIFIGVHIRYSFADNNKRMEYLVSDYGKNLMSSMPQNSLIFVDGDLPYGSLLYLESIGAQKAITVIHVGMLNHDWYIKNLSLRYPGMFNNDLVQFSEPSDRLEKIIRDNLSKRSVFTRFPSWEQEPSDFVSVPIGILYQVVGKGSDIKNMISSNKAWENYELRSFRSDRYKDTFLNNLVFLSLASLNDTAEVYYNVGYFNESELALRKMLEISLDQRIENNLKRVIKAKLGTGP